MQRHRYALSSIQPHSTGVQDAPKLIQLPRGTLSLLNTAKDHDATKLCSAPCPQSQQVCTKSVHPHAHAVQCAGPHLTPQSVAQAGPLAGSRWISISGQCHLHHAARMRTESVSQCSHARVHACLGCARALCQPQRFSRRTGPNHAPRDQVNTDVSMGAWMPPGLSYQPQRCSR